LVWIPYVKVLESINFKRNTRFKKMTGKGKHKSSGDAAGDVTSKTSLNGKIHSCEPVLMFPFSHPTRFISLMDNREKEVATINDMNDLNAESRNILKDKLSRRYLIPVIRDIVRVKREFGIYRWEVLTDRGRSEFYTKGRSENVTFLTDTRILLTDITNCRYEIKDTRALPRHARIELDKII